MANEEKSTARARAWAWDQYWRDGRLASCGGEGGSGYQDAIAIGWYAFFGRLPQGSRILDVCSGNGAIARLAEKIANQRGIRFAIDAVDAARLVPPGIDIGGMVRFHSRVEAEQLPFPANSFDVVVGQYAIEYTNLPRSLAEMARVSGTECRLRFLTHAREGIVVGNARRQLTEIDQLRNSDIFAAANSLAQAQGNPTLSPEAMHGLRQRYQDAAQSVAQAAARSVEPVMFTNTTQVFNHALSVQRQVGTQTIVDKIAEVRGSIEAHAARLDAMVEASVDENGVRELAERIGNLWAQELRVDACFRADGALLGWVLESAGKPET